MEQNQAAFVPPHNIEAERSVLGSMFLDPRAVFIALEHLTPQDFYSRRNQLIFETMAELSEAGMPIDIVTVVDRLERRGLLTDPDDTLYIADLAGSVPSAASVQYYVGHRSAEIGAAVAYRGGQPDHPGCRHFGGGRGPGRQPRGD